MMIDSNTWAAAAMGIALSACCGFRVFIPMLIAGLSSRFHWFHWFQFTGSFLWLSTTPALVSLATAAVVEIAAYYIPFVDNILDAMATPLSMAAGALLATSVMPVETEWMKWTIGIIAGGGGAGLIASGTGLLRLLSSKVTLGSGNAVVATAENTAAITGSVMSLLLPVFMAAIFIILFFYLAKKTWTKFTSGTQK
ncbi:MAG TPA: DUF4126 domain-containing protein [Flavipsychrobacter sp.]|nr:DUF4126 domain-containing protein [Flavipsychrobacter sp.]